jgi:hypothetical protein
VSERLGVFLDIGGGRRHGYVDYVDEHAAGTATMSSSSSSV